MNLSLIIFLAVTGTAICADDPDSKEVFEAYEDCTKKFKIKEEQVAGLLLMTQPAITDDEKCFVKCIVEESGFINKDDLKPNTEKLMKNPFNVFVKSKIAPGIEKCGKVSGNSPCETVYEQTKCLIKEAGDQEFLKSLN